jgi:hypothetical protein
VADRKTLYCSFCGKSQHEVRKLIAGPTVFICDECVELCDDIVKDDLGKLGLQHVRETFLHPKFDSIALEELAKVEFASGEALLQAVGLAVDAGPLNAREVLQQIIDGFDSKIAVQMTRNRIALIEKKLGQNEEDVVNKLRERLEQLREYERCQLAG